jgi:hypothetical protein
LAANLETDCAYTAGGLHALAAHYEGYGKDPTQASAIRAAMIELGWTSTRRNNQTVWRWTADAREAA